MGLDITAYPEVALVATRETATDEQLDSDELVRLYPLEPFLAAADGLVDGVYSVVGKPFHFRAGSYGGYNEWRRQLAKLVGKTAESVWDNPQPGPFVELINNADSEGVIGPLTSAKLAADFAEWQARAEVSEQAQGDPWFMQKYNEWRRAFEIARGGGAVRLS